VVEYFSYYEAQVIVSFVEQGLNSKEISDLLRSEEKKIIQFLKENNLYKEENKKEQHKKQYTPITSTTKGNFHLNFSGDKEKTGKYRKKLRGK
jgi:hypothetical protein